MFTGNLCFSLSQYQALWDPCLGGPYEGGGAPHVVADEPNDIVYNSTITWKNIIIKKTHGYIIRYFLRDVRTKGAMEEGHQWVLAQEVEEFGEL